MSDVFISYSRRDQEFVRAVHDALVDAGRTGWVDWNDIPPTAEWLTEVFDAIRASDAFLFVITPHSAASDTCRKEIAEAARLNKRIVPLLREPVDAAMLPDPLPRLNWILSRQHDEFAESVRKLLAALDLDLDWVRVHTRLLVRATEWDLHDRDTAFTLRGSDLDRAERWLEAGPDKQPAPTTLHTEYVLASRRAQTQRQRALLTGVSVALILSLALAAIAWYQRQQAVARRYVSIAQYLAASAEQELQHGRRDERAALLARQAYNFNERYGGERLAQIDAALRLVLGAPHPAIELRPTAGEGELTAVTYSRTGQWLAAADSRERVHLWDTARPDRAARVLPHTSGTIAVLAFSPVEDLLAAGMEDGDLRFWDLQGARNMPALRLGEVGEPVTAMAFDAQGRHIAAATRERGIHLVTIEGQQAQRTRRCCAAAGLITAIAFESGPGWQIVTGNADGAIEMWNAGTDRRIRSLPPARSAPVETLAISASGRIAAGYAQQTQISLFDAAFEGREPEARVEPGVVVVWDENGSQSQVLEGHESSVVGLTFLTDGRLVSAGGRDGAVRLWTLGPTPTAVLLEPRLEAATAVASHPAGTAVAAVDGARRVVRVWNLSPPVGAPQALRGHTGGIVGLAFAPAGDRLAAAATDDGTVAVWDVATGLESFPFGRRPDDGTAVAFSPDGGLLAIGSRAEGGAGTIHVWNTGDPPRPPRSLPAHASAVRGIDFDPTGMLLLSAGRFDRQLRLWKVDGGQAPAHVWDSGSDEVLAARFGAGSRYVAWIGKDPEVRVWDRNRAEAPPVRLHCEVVTLSGLAFSRSVPTLAAGGAGGPICVWDVTTSDRRTLDPGEDVVSLAIDDTGTLLAAGSPTGIVRVWDLEHADWAPRTLTGLPSAVTALAFGPGSAWLAGGSDTGGSPVLLWRSTADLARAVCAQSRRSISADEWQRFVGADVPTEATCPER